MHARHQFALRYELLDGNEGHLCDLCSRTLHRHVGSLPHHRGVFSLVLYCVKREASPSSKEILDPASLHKSVMLFFDPFLNVRVSCKPATDESGCVTIFDTACSSNLVWTCSVEDGEVDGLGDVSLFLGEPCSEEEFAGCVMDVHSLPDRLQHPPVPCHHGPDAQFDLAVVGLDDAAPLASNEHLLDRSLAIPWDVLKVRLRTGEPSRPCPRQFVTGVHLVIGISQIEHVVEIGRDHLPALSILQDLLDGLAPLLVRGQCREGSFVDLGRTRGGAPDHRQTQLVEEHRSQLGRRVEREAFWKWIGCLKSRTDSTLQSSLPIAVAALHPLCNGGIHFHTVPLHLVEGKEHPHLHVHELTETLFLQLTLQLLVDFPSR